MKVTYSGECECGRTVRRGFDPDTDSSTVNSNAGRRIRSKCCGQIVLCSKDTGAEVANG